MLYYKWKCCRSEDVFYAKNIGELKRLDFTNSFYNGGRLKMLVVVVRYPALKEGKDAKSLTVPLGFRETD